MPLTILLTVLTVNAINFIDGLDGLAAGVSAIAALAFFAYSYHLGLVGLRRRRQRARADHRGPRRRLPRLPAAQLQPGPDLHGRLRLDAGRPDALGGRGDRRTGQADPQTFDSAATPAARSRCRCCCRSRCWPSRSSTWCWPSIRRTRKGRSPFSPDKLHLHHRLLEIGHSHRRAVLLMYFWAALLAFGAVALSITGGRAELLIAIGVLLVVGVVVVLSPRARRAAREARAAELAAQRERSRADHPTARALRPTTRSRPGQCRADARPTRRSPRDADALERALGPLLPPGRGAGRRGRDGGRGARSPGCSPGWADAVGVLVGAVIVTAFFCVSGVVVAWAGRIDDTFTLPAALGMFFVKALLLFAVLTALPEHGWLDRRDARVRRRRRRAALERGPAALGLDPPAVLRSPARPAGCPTVPAAPTSPPADPESPAARG